MRRLLRRLADVSPATILIVGWVGLFVYAYPGFMSFDSVSQLEQSRSGVYLDNHPPAMAALWHCTELLVTGPVGMLVLQTVAFLAGVYLLLVTRLTRRRAAIAAVLLLWCPPITNTMSVIWKDSQMAAYLVLGTALVVSPRLRVRIAGLVFVALATAMRHNAFAMTFPIVGLLFYWSIEHRWWQRYTIAIAAWVAVTLAAQAATTMLADRHVAMWHQSLALLDIVGTIRYSEPLSDEQLRAELAGTPLAFTDHLQDHARAKVVADATPVDELWNATNTFFHRPDAPTAEQQAAIGKAWTTIVIGHPGAYLRYRLVVFGQLVQLDDTPLGSPIYCWFTDVQDPYGSGDRISHFAAPSRLQEASRDVMQWFGDTWLFHVGLYMILSVALLPLCWRDRESFALLASGIAGQAGLFVIAPSVDVRYSFWLIVSVLLAIVLVAARRIRSRAWW